ncbi:MAG: hypothetical protein AAF899_01310 [Pseudomonadota bacterium]
MFYSAEPNTHDPARPPFRRIAVASVLASAFMGHVFNLANSELWALVFSMAAVAVIVLSLGSINHYWRTGQSWRTTIRADRGEQETG